MLPSLGTAIATRHATMALASAAVRPALCTAARGISTRASSAASHRRRSSAQESASTDALRTKVHIQKAFELEPQELEDLTHTALFAPTFRKPGEVFPMPITKERLQDAADVYGQLGVTPATAFALFEDTVKFNASSMSRSQLAEVITAVSQAGIGMGMGTSSLLSTSHEAQSMLWASMGVGDPSSGAN